MILRAFCRLGQPNAQKLMRCNKCVSVFYATAAIHIFAECTFFLDSFPAGDVFGANVLKCHLNPDTLAIRLACNSFDFHHSLCDLSWLRFIHFRPPHQLCRTNNSIDSNRNGVATRKSLLVNDVVMR